MMEPTTIWIAGKRQENELVIYDNSKDRILISVPNFPYIMGFTIAN
jgi:hypothetical protein